VSADGRFIAFLSPASNLVPSDTNGVVDVFVRDNVAQVTTRVSTTSTGAQLTVPSADRSISHDGRYVAFVTKAPLVAADNVVAGDSDVYVKDRQTGAVTWASVRAGSLALVGDCLGDEISGDGTKVHSIAISRSPSVRVCSSCGPPARGSATSSSVRRPARTPCRPSRTP
jgi:hypothetical protein